MPRYREPMKDVISCDKLRVRANICIIRRSPNGETRLRIAQSLAYEYIVCKRERCEVKHLSSSRKRKQK